MSREELTHERDGLRQRERVTGSGQHLGQYKSALWHQWDEEEDNVGGAPKDDASQIQGDCVAKEGVDRRAEEERGEHVCTKPETLALRIQHHSFAVRIKVTFGVASVESAEIWVIVAGGVPSKPMRATVYASAASDLEYRT